MKKGMGLGATREIQGVDVAKGVVIILVVLGHIVEGRMLSGESRYEWIWTIIYSFHMPFWFVLSGLLFSGPQQTKAYFVKKFRHLGVPYLSFLLLFNLKAILGFAINMIGGDLTPEKVSFYVNHFLTQMIGGEGLGGFQMIMWFPACLFFTQQLSNYILHFSSTIQYFLLGLLFVLGSSNEWSDPSFYLPLALNVVPMASFFFIIAHKFRDTLLGAPFLGTTVIASLFLLSSVFLFENSYFKMRQAFYGVPIISHLGAISVSVIVLRTASTMSRHSIFNAIGQIGRGSMVIMYIHVIVLRQFTTQSTWIITELVLATTLPFLFFWVIEKNNRLSKLLLGVQRYTRA